MDALFTLLLGLLAAAATFLFQNKKLKETEAQRDLLDLELKKSVKKQKAREAALITATKKVTYEKAREKFLNDYADILSNNNAGGSATSDGGNDNSGNDN